MTVPNLISAIRIILAPIFVIYLINDQILPGLIVFMIAGASDAVDGFIARVFNQKSRLGTYLDPIADKIVLISAFVGLSVRELLPAWLAVTVISRDVLIVIGVTVLFMNYSKIVIRPMILSKITTCFQFITVITAFTQQYSVFLANSHRYLIYLTALSTIVSGLQYMHKWFKMMGEAV
ncbi:MAG: CDP-alcohol phosphatidyltransferase family protein [Deltaproteobacteria bacterium]|nr:CDP-alcohol phosphatidyltransferase family protein [Deltaproteobacteria bacterium]